MGVLIPPESGYAQERRKWEAQHSEAGPPGKPYAYMQFPEAMYKAIRPDLGGTPILECENATTERHAAELERRGFVSRYGDLEGPLAAIARLEAYELDVAKLAAERVENERRMSPQAQAEAARVDAETDQHVPVIPETPKGLKGKKVTIEKNDTPAAPVKAAKEQH